MKATFSAKTFRAFTSAPGTLAGAGSSNRYVFREPRRYSLRAKPARLKIRVADAQLSVIRNLTLSEEEEFGALLLLY